MVANVDNTSEAFKNTIMAARTGHQGDKTDQTVLIAALRAFEDHLFKAADAEFVL